MHESRAAFYRGRRHEGRTVLILGAGNLTCLPAMDVVTKLFNEAKVCLLKMSPINAYAGPLDRGGVRRGDPARLPRRGVRRGGRRRLPGESSRRRRGASDRLQRNLRCPGVGTAGTRAGVAQGARHAAPDEAGDGGARQRVARARGAGSVPGPGAGLPGGEHRGRAGSQHRFQLQHAAGAGRRREGGPPGEVSSTRSSARWVPHPLDLRTTPARRSVGGASPGHAKVRGPWARPAPSRLPWTLLPGLDATDPTGDGIHGRTVLSDPLGDRSRQRRSTRIPGARGGLRQQPALGHAGRGPRGPSLVAEGPANRRGSRASDRASSLWCRLDELVEWPSPSSSARPPWGAFPASTPSDIQSGTGWVHNTPMLEGIEKAVLRHPITVVPKPTTFPSHRTAHVVLRRLTRMEERASWTRVPGVIAAAMRG